MTDNPVFIRPAIVVALISFLGTVAFAYYIEKRGKP
jgi:multisubunit Na+/H+ antiporter MnhF subunit